MYFSKWHFLFCCLVLIRIITTLIRSVYTMVLKVCDELELLLTGDVDTTFNRKEAYPYKYHDLSSTQSQASDIVDRNVKPTNIDFEIPDLPAEKRVMVRGIDRKEAASKAQHHTSDILTSPGIIKRTRDEVFFKLDGSDPYKVPISSTLDGIAVTSQNRNVQVKSNPQRICNSQNETYPSSSKSISISAESPSCTISSDERKDSKNKVTGSYLSTAPQPILPQSETSSSSSAVLFQRNVNPVGDTSIQSNESFDNTCSVLKTYEKKKSKGIEKNLIGPNLKDSEVSLETNNENNAERSIFNSNLPAASDLRKQDCQSTNNPIEDDSFKDTHEERNYNEIENTELENGVINVKREDTNSKSFSTNIRANVSKSEEEEEEEPPLIRALRVGNPIYVNYLREAWPVFDEIENAILSLCKTHFNKSLITEDELQVVHSALRKLFEVSEEVNELAYHLYIDVYKRETEVIISKLEHDIALSIYSSLHMKASYYMKEISRKMGKNRLLIFNATPESQKLRIQMAKPKNSPKKSKSKRRK